MKITINNREYDMPENITILEAVKKANIKIPTLCYIENMEPYGGCRLCVVEVEGSKTLVPSCAVNISDGMKIKTHSEKVRKVRKTIMQLIVASHGISCELNCLTCPRSTTCELKIIAEEIGVTKIDIPPVEKNLPSDFSSFSIVREPTKCIVCGRCIRACSNIQGVNIFTFANRGPNTIVTTFLDEGMGNVDCTNCGQCVMNCPTGALHEVYHIDGVWKALNDPDKITVVQTAPAVRVALGEPFGMEPGTISTGKMVSALRLLGFDRVFDTNFTADLTIVEEGTEFIHRFKEGGKLPLFTSCSPGWIKFIEHNYPEYLPNLSTAKSPQQMFGAVAKHYYAKKLGVPKEKLVVVSIMPCTAKKYEMNRPELAGDVDFVLTTRELAKMIKESGIDFRNLPEEEYDNPFGISTGAGVIFGASGGVMEAALRTAYEILTGKELEKLDFVSVRGLTKVKEAEVEINGKTIKVAVVNTLGAARKLLEKIKNGEVEYHFVEFMACPGGCIGGGGQPIPTNEEVLLKRMESIYEIDYDSKLRKSHENPAVKELYKEFLKEPNSEIAHHYLHTHYIARN
ncbi:MULTISPECIES: NADH-dependent [FeFe] hydrogenase, group A6 [unclassified Marinitoga]|uniref:NADH-dependent [FeFe] hydrogenase, group A6 n=1 Tax=unclassified Marinitoga TaxID=2640159 RepID=UPI000640BEC7|nr:MULTISPECIES: NADH-dependent [FeFe] hydrogenase, group A6 [unclassified Marinitoga]KLO23719.1 ferredoxin [Marinitoga sp. 1155]NUV00125.1 ferredoxin [Marinitoga sp. 1154]